MNTTEDTLRSYYADQPDDLAAEQRLRRVIRSGTGAKAARVRPSPPRRGWLVAASAAGVTAILAGAIVAAAHTDPGRSTAADPAPSPLVTVTPQAAMQTLIDLLPAGGTISGTAGTGVAGSIAGNLNYQHAGQTAMLNLALCYPTDGPAANCPLPMPNLDAGDVYAMKQGSPPTTSTLADGSRLTVTAMRPIQARTGQPAFFATVVLARADGVTLHLTEAGPTPLDAQPAVSANELVAIARSPKWTTEVPATLAQRDASLFVPLVPDPANVWPAGPSR